MQQDTTKYLTTKYLYNRINTTKDLYNQRFIEQKINSTKIYTSSNKSPAFSVYLIN